MSSYSFGSVPRQIYSDIDLARDRQNYEDSARQAAVATLSARNDPAAARIKRLINMPDLTEVDHSPICLIARRIASIPALANFARVTVPEVLNQWRNFDVLTTPSDHPSRRPSDTFYLDSDHVLRTQMTTMWSFFRQLESTQEAIAQRQPLRAMAYGAVYRKDDLDRTHSPKFHQMDGLYLVPRDQAVITQEDLKEILSSIARSVFGEDVIVRFNPDTFPYTHESLELEIFHNDRWLEVLGAGLVKPDAMQSLNIDPEIYNGWAFGFGLDRLAMIKLSIPDIRILYSTDERVVQQLKSLDGKFQPISKFPGTSKDISFLAPKEFPRNDFFGMVEAIGASGDEMIIRQAELLERYENDSRFGVDRASFCFRIHYQSDRRTLLSEEVNLVQSQIRSEVVREFGVELR